LLVCLLADGTGGWGTKKPQIHAETFLLPMQCCHTVNGNKAVHLSATTSKNIINLQVSPVCDTVKISICTVILLLLFAVNVAHRCIHCQKLAPIWQQFAESFDRAKFITIAEVDCSQHYSLCHEQGVSSSS